MTRRLWSREEDAQLVAQIEANIPLEDIARFHKRSVVAIQMRIKTHTLPYLVEDFLRLMKYID